MDLDYIKTFLDEKTNSYNQSEFIADDPISIPHQFSKKEDIEIVGFIVAIIAWGNRASIIKSGNKLVEIMGGEPYNFVMEYESRNKIQFVHRTFNAQDLDFFFRSLKNIYQNHGGLELAFSEGCNAKDKILTFRKRFLEIPHAKRSEKHIANPEKGSSAKRLNMFLRWMIRQDKRGVDFGLWRSHSMRELYVPLDVHTATSARTLGLISRKANDWKSLEELMSYLREFCPEDPCKYDFALFGLSANKELTQFMS